MKKIAIVLSFIIVLAMILGVSALADSDTVYTYGFLQYVIVDDAIQIIKYFGNDRDVTVPNSIAGYPVSSIGENAFVDTNAKNVYLPDTIMYTETGAFGKDVTVIYSDGKNQYESNHVWDEGVVESYPTCAQTGKIVYTCALCKATKDITVAKLSNHTYDTDCDSECNVCGFKRNVVHTPGELMYDENEHFNYCTVCGEKINAEKHIKGSEATESSPCKCTVCSFVLTPALGHTHSLVLVPGVASTCTEPGNTEYYKCSGCGEIFSDANGNNKIKYSDVLLKPNGHSIVIDEAVASTVDNYGKSAGSHCSVCGKVLIEQKPILPINKAVEKTGGTILCGTHSVVKSEDGDSEVFYVNNDEYTDDPNLSVIIDSDGFEDDAVIGSPEYINDTSDFESSGEFENESSFSDSSKSSDTSVALNRENSDLTANRTVWIVTGIAVALVVVAGVVFIVYKRKKTDSIYS